VGGALLVGTAVELVSWGRRSHSLAIWGTVVHNLLPGAALVLAGPRLAIASMPMIIVFIAGQVKTLSPLTTSTTA